jgi:hypothetical protein
VGLFAVADSWAPAVALQPLPPLTTELSWLEWIEEHAEPDAALAFLPFPEGRSARDYLGTAQWMYWQVRHWRPMVNGYSGFFPAGFRQLKEDLRGFPSERGLRALREREVRWVIAHRSAVLPGRADGYSAGALGLRRVFADEAHSIDVYRLVAADAPAILSAQ